MYIVSPFNTVSSSGTPQEQSRLDEYLIDFKIYDLA